MFQLNRSFITPFDREDIGALAHSLDDVTDLIQATADTMVLYKVKTPGKRAKELADIICQITKEVEIVMPSLRKHNANLEKANFKGAFNYYIDPLKNRLKNARFSYPEVLALLIPFGIKIEN